MKKNATSSDTVAIRFQNVRSLGRYSDIVSDNRIITNSIIGFKDTQIRVSDSTSKVRDMLNFLNISFNTKENKILSLAYEWCYSSEYI